MAKPYNPKKLPFDDLDWSVFVTDIARANAALAKYDGVLESIPNPRVLLSPLITQEAVLSSRIEGTQATLQEVLEFEADPTKEAPRYGDIHEIINYRRALTHGEKSLLKKPLGLNLIKEMHEILLDGVRGEQKRRGQFRSAQNWIGKDGCKIEQATYVPPSPLNLIEHLSNWEKYFHFDERERLVQLGIIHAQFELIHPFLDGNGRIGRLLVPLFLSQANVLSSPMFYLSSYLESTRKEYYARLQGISEDDDWNGWIVYFLQAVHGQAVHNIEQAKEILALYREMKDLVAAVTRSQFAIRTLDILFEEPVFSSSDFVSRSKIPRASALRILGSLKDGRIIKSIREGKGRKPTLYAFPKLLEIVAE